MTTPIPTDEQIAEELSSALLADASRVTPEPALRQILTRAHQAGPNRSTKRGTMPHRREWLPALAGAAATAAVFVAGIVVFAPGDDSSTPRFEPSATGDWPTPCDGCPLDLAVWYHSPGGDELVSGTVTVTSSGDVGMDAVEALLTNQPSPMGNPWGGLADRPVAEVNSVAFEPIADVVTVDFDRPLTASASMEGEDTPFSSLTIQQLVLTVQSALRTNAPVLITTNGEPAEEAFEIPLSGPIPANGSVVSGIRLSMPAQRMVVQSPVRIFGSSTTNEGTVLWEVTQDGEVVRDGYTTGGAMGTYGEFSFRVALEPGSYTVKLWEPSVASGPEAWTDEMSVVYVDILVE